MRLRSVDIYKCTKCQGEFEYCPGASRDTVILGLSAKKIKRGDKQGTNVYADFCPACTELFLKFCNL